MKRYFPAVPALLAAFAVLIVSAAPVRAEVRPVSLAGFGSDLQTYLNSMSENINVNTDQVPDTQRWKSTVAGNSAMTLMIEMAFDAEGNAVGVYNAGDADPALYEIFPGTATAGQFAMASFRLATQKLTVTLFNEDGTVANAFTHDGVTTDDFGYYISNPSGGIGYSQDARNSDEQARMLVYKGTDENNGNWWLCFEDGDPYDPDNDRDFDDAVMFVESINPTPVSRMSWGQLKSRFR